MRPCLCYTQTSLFANTLGIMFVLMHELSFESNCRLTEPLWVIFLESVCAGNLLERMVDSSNDVRYTRHARLPRYRLLLVNRILLTQLLFVIILLKEVFLEV